MRRSLVVLSLLSLSLPSTALALKGLPVAYAPSGVGVLFPQRDVAVDVVVKDERPEKLVLASGLGGDGGTGLFLAYYATKPEALAEHLAAAAREAVGAVGLRTGTGGDVLTLTVKEMRIDVFFHGMSNLKHSGFGVVEAAVVSPDGRETRRSFRIPSYDSGAKRAEEQFAWVWSRVGWQAAAQALLAHRPADPDDAAVKKLCAGLTDDSDDDLLRAQRVFWLGLLPHPTPAAVDTLLALLKSEKRQRVTQAAADALGMLGVAEARGELLALLTGSTKNPYWELKVEGEPVWHLVRPLTLLDTPDLDAKIPAPEHGARLVANLRRFVATGEIPERSDKEKEKLAKALTKLKK